MKNARRPIVALLMAAGILLAACSRIPIAPVATLTPVSPTYTTTPSPHPIETSLPATDAPPPSHTLMTVDAAYQIVRNSSFDRGTGYWSARVGKLSRSASQYYTAPGSGYITTNGSGNVGVAAQCLSVEDIRMDWPTTDGQKQITFEAFLKTDVNIDQVRLVIIFHQGDCGRPDEFHVQVGGMESTPISGARDWTRVSTSGILPGDALSVDIIIWADGKDSSARVYFDDVRSYPSNHLREKD